MNSRNMLYAGLGCVLAPLLAPGTALAQDMVAAQENNSGLNDIIVTAQRRSERLQDVPVSITAADSEALATARVENIANVQAISPSITFRVANNSTSSANVIIRGLGTTGNARAFEGSVGVFIDGVYRTRAAAALQSFLDIDNLQIARGPQGTLFGKNTTAGAILLTSTRPTTTGPEGSVDLSYGNYDMFTARAAANMPLSDKAAIRIAGLTSHTDGFFKDPNGGSYMDDSTQSVKTQLLVDATDALTVRLIGDYTRSTGNCCYATANFIDGPTQPLVDALTLAAGLKLPSTRMGDFQQALNGRGHQRVEDFGGTLLIDLDTGSGSLKSVTAVRKFDVQQRDMDADFSGADLMRYNEGFTSRFISQELTYNWKIPSIGADIVVGGFFSDEKLTMTRSEDYGSQSQTYWDAIFGELDYPAGTIDAVGGRWFAEAMAGKARSYAAFAHGDFRLNDQFSVIAGLRYSIEKKNGSFRYDYYRPQLNDAFRVLGVFPGPAFDRTITQKALSGTFGVQYRPMDDVMVYATYNRGFKAGGVNIDANAAGLLANNPAVVPGAVPLDPAYAPEKINAYELGVKAEYLDRRARTNIALFYYDASNVQIAQFVGLRFAVVNASKAKDYGLEIENLFEIVPGITLGLDGTYLAKAEFGNDPAIGAALSGTRFRFAPKFQGNATVNVDTPLADNLHLIGRLQYQYSGRQLVNTASQSARGAVSLINANIGVRLPDTGLTIELWGQNLTDRTVVNYAFNTPIQTGDENAYLAPPRTYGVRLRADF